ncbi:MAG: ATP-binding protein [Actinomycetes bacterium]
MARARSLADLPRGVGLALVGLTTRDDVTHAVLVELLRTPPVVRAGVALSELGGRQLRFCSSDFLRESRDRLDLSPDSLPGKGALGSDSACPVPWCEIDGMADVPLVRALLSGSPVLLGSLAALGARYPHLVEHQASLGTRSLAALPLTSSDGQRVGALLITLGRPLALARYESALCDAAGLVADAVARTRRPRDRAFGVGGTGTGGAVGDGRPLVLHLAADESAPRRAREFLRRLLAGRDVDAGTGQDAELCLSEVVTNAVIHARTSMEIAITLDGGRLTVAVRDGGAPAASDPAASFSGRGGRANGRAAVPNGSSQPAAEAPDVGGRGLLLVEHLTERWSYETTTQGTTASFEMLLRPPARV